MNNIHLPTHFGQGPIEDHDWHHVTWPGMKWANSPNMTHMNHPASNASDSLAQSIYPSIHLCRGLCVMSGSTWHGMAWPDTVTWTTSDNTSDRKCIWRLGTIYSFAEPREAKSNDSLSDIRKKKKKNEQKWPKPPGSQMSTRWQERTGYRKIPDMNKNRVGGAASGEILSLFSMRSSFFS